MRLIRLLGATLLLVLVSSPAFADATLFIGSTTTPTNRPAKGFAVGMGLLVVGFEFEFAETSENLVEGAPSLRTGMGNVLAQTPAAVAGMQFYLTTGGGVYRELIGDRQETRGREEECEPEPEPLPGQPPEPRSHHALRALRYSHSNSRRTPGVSRDFWYSSASLRETSANVG